MSYTAQELCDRLIEDFAAHLREVQLPHFEKTVAKFGNFLDFGAVIELDVHALIAPEDFTGACFMSEDKFLLGNKHFPEDAAAFVRKHAKTYDK